MAQPALLPIKRRKAAKGRLWPVAVLAVLVAGIASPSTAKEVWGFWSGKGEALLSYGIPESEAVTLIINCELPSRRGLFIVSTVFPATARPGQAIQLRLSTSAAALSYAGKIGVDKGHDTRHVEVPKPADHKIFALLRSGELLRIEAGGERRSISLKGVQKPLAQLERKCGVPQPAGKRG